MNIKKEELFALRERVKECLEKYNKKEHLNLEHNPELLKEIIVEDHNFIYNFDLIKKIDLTGFLKIYNT